jgi:Flp pilus assembly protein TadG
VTARRGFHAAARSAWDAVRRCHRDDTGSAAAEITLLTPLLIVLLLFVVFCGRVADTELRVDDVAHQAARAASLARSPGQATVDAQSAATAALSTAGVTCQSLTVATDTQGLRPGGTVTATVSCSVGLSDLALLGVPGAKTFQASFASPIDVYRGTQSSSGGS